MRHDFESLRMRGMTLSLCLLEQTGTPVEAYETPDGNALLALRAIVLGEWAELPRRQLIAGFYLADETAKAWGPVVLRTHSDCLGWQMDISAQARIILGEQS